jgi:ABC-2 type transport system permease protein
MSTATLDRHSSLVFAEERKPARSHSAPMSALIKVELRKAVDTRAGRWLLVTVALVGIAAIAITAFAGKTANHTYSNVLSNGAQFTALLLPVLGALLVTGEWSQHTALTTFTLVPKRGRVMTAKTVAAIAIGIVAAVAVAGLSALAVAFAAHPASGGQWDMNAGALLNSVLYQELMIIIGVSLGLLFRNTPVAIVAYFAIPTAWGVLTGTVSGLHTVQNWADMSTAFPHLLNATVPAKAWAQVGVSALIWVAVPYIAGRICVRKGSIS